MPLVQGQVPVKANINLHRFHSLTERARYTVGGVHNLEFDLEIVNAQTGQVIVPNRRMEANLPAYGGAAAVAADARGNSQKKRITENLTKVLAKTFGAKPLRSTSQSVEITRQAGSASEG